MDTFSDYSTMWAVDGHSLAQKSEAKSRHVDLVDTPFNRLPRVRVCHFDGTKTEGTVVGKTFEADPRLNVLLDSGKVLSDVPATQVEWV